MMLFKVLNGFVALSLLTTLCFGHACGQSSDEPAGVQIVLERVERVNPGEVHFWLKIENGSDKPIFTAGTNFEKPIPELVFLEQWQAKGGWKTLVPCIDTLPPHVIRLSPSGTITWDLVLKVPLFGVCKERDIQLTGKFRYRLNYFESQTRAETYLKKLFSPEAERPRANVAVSEPFEIPPPHDP